MKRVIKAGIGLAVVAAVGAGVFQVTRADTSFAIPAIRDQPDRSSPVRAAVATLVDGETFEVRTGGQTTRIRLLGIATPAPAASDRPGQCLGPESSAFLASVIPVGSEVQLAYGEDQLGRSGAAASTADGRLVNTEIVRAGLAEGLSIGDGPAALSRASIEAAAQEATANQRGLHSPKLPCTVPGQVKAVLDLVARVPAAVPPGARGVDLNNLANAATDARVAADRMVWAFAENRRELTWRVLGSAELADLRGRITEARDRVTTSETALRVAANMALNAEATQGAAQAQAARIAHQLVVIRRAEARRIAAAARRAEAARQAEATRRHSDRKSDRDRGKRQHDEKKDDRNKSDK